MLFLIFATRLHNNRTPIAHDDQTPIHVMNTPLKNFLLIALLGGALVACKKDEDDPPPSNPPVNEEELITTLRLHFHSANDVEHKHFEFADLDGDGGLDPVITADALSADSVYMVEIEVLNESVSPAETISLEIAEEDLEHQFFFQVSGANATVAYADADADGNPVGLLSTWTCGALSSGTVVVTLRHEPNKSAAGVAAGDITNAGGETDIEVTFPLVVQ